jgi:hypothetical protein
MLHLIKSYRIDAGQIRPRDHSLATPASTGPCASCQKISTWKKSVKILSLEPSPNPFDAESFPIAAPAGNDKMSHIDYALYESPVGYALFKVVHQQDAVGLKLKETQAAVNDLAKFGKMVKLANFSPFRYFQLGCAMLMDAR